MIFGLPKGNMIRKMLPGKYLLQKLLFMPQGKILVACFIISVCCSLFIFCKNDFSKLPENIKSDYENERAFDVEFIYSENGQTKSQLFTKEFLKNDQARPPYMDMLNGLHVNFFNDSMQIESHLKAKYARYYPQSGNILVRDSVVVVNKLGDMLETEELIWNQKLQKFYTEKFVKITSSGQVSYGEGMEANQDFTWFRITNQRGAIPVNSEELPTMDSSVNSDTATITGDLINLPYHYANVQIAFEGICFPQR